MLLTSSSFFIPVILSIIVNAAMTSATNEVKVEILHKVENAKRLTQRGDTIDVHYSGTLASDGSEFDSSYKRKQPLSFTVGRGQVIKGYVRGDNVDSEVID